MHPRLGDRFADQTVVNVALPALREDFHATLAWIAAAARAHGAAVYTQDADFDDDLPGIEVVHV